MIFSPRYSSSKDSKTGKSPRKGGKDNLKDEKKSNSNISLTVKAKEENEAQLDIYKMEGPFIRNNGAHFVVQAIGCKKVFISLIHVLTDTDSQTLTNSFSPVPTPHNTLKMPFAHSSSSGSGHHHSSPTHGHHSSSLSSSLSSLASSSHTNKSQETHHSDNHFQQWMTKPKEYEMYYDESSAEYLASVDLPEGKHCFKYIFYFEQERFGQPKAISPPGYACYLNGYAVFYMKGERLSSNPICNEIRKNMPVETCIKSEIEKSARALSGMYSDMKGNEYLFNSSNANNHSLNEQLSQLAKEPAFNLETFLESHHLASNSLDLEFMEKPFNSSQPYEGPKRAISEHATRAHSHSLSTLPLVPKLNSNTEPKILSRSNPPTPHVPNKKKVRSRLSDITEEARKSNRHPLSPEEQSQYDFLSILSCLNEEDMVLKRIEREQAIGMDLGTTIDLNFNNSPNSENKPSDIKPLSFPLSLPHSPLTMSSITPPLSPTTTHVSHPNARQHTRVAPSKGLNDEHAITKSLQKLNLEETPTKQNNNNNNLIVSDDQYDGPKTINETPNKTQNDHNDGYMPYIANININNNSALPLDSTNQSIDPLKSQYLPYQNVSSHSDNESDEYSATTRDSTRDNTPQSYSPFSNAGYLLGKRNSKRSSASFSSFSELSNASSSNSASSSLNNSAAIPFDYETKQFIDELPIKDQFKRSLSLYLGKCGVFFSDLTSLSNTLLEETFKAADIPPPVCGIIIRSLKEKANTETSVDWNLPYQILDSKLQRLFNTTRTGAHHVNLCDRYKLYLAMHELYDNFVQTATIYGKLIISEMGLPDSLKTISPDFRFGGVAGGHKLTKHGILFKFANDMGSKNDATKLYRGDIEAAMKVAGHDLRSLIQIKSLNIDGLKLPMMVLIDYLGFRLVAESILPIDSTTHYLGSADGGKTVKFPQTKECELVKKMAQIGDRLHLAEHKVDKDISLHTPIDLEGHMLPNGDYYILDYSRLFPPEGKPQEDCPHSYLFRLLRPEFVRTYPVYLSPDAHSWFTYPNTEAERNKHNTELDIAVQHLHNTVIPNFAIELLQMERMQIDKKCNSSLDSSLLIQKLHGAGINCRHLGLVLHAVNQNKNSFFHLALSPSETKTNSPSHPSKSHHSPPHSLSSSPKSQSLHSSPSHSYVSTSPRIPQSMWSKLIFIEMISRLMKCKLRHIMRTTLNQNTRGLKRAALQISNSGRMGTSLNRVYANIVFYFNLIFGSDQQSENHWKETLKEELCNKYGSVWMNDTYTTKNKGQFLKILNNVCQLTGIELSPGTFDIIIKHENKEITFWDIPKPFDVVDIEAIHIRTKQTTDGANAGASIIRYEACNTNENEDKKMAKFALAIKQYKKILMVNPKCAHVLFHIADCYCHLSYLYLNSQASAQHAEKYKILAEEYYSAACLADPKDSVAAHKYALFLEIHKTDKEHIDTLKISKLYYSCISENPKFTNGLFDYGRFLVTKCGLKLGFDFMGYGLVESGNDRNLSIQLDILKREYNYDLHDHKK